MASTPGVFLGPYEIRAPKSHAFRITHDHTGRREGTKYYFNIARAGSHVTDPGASIWTAAKN